MQTLHFVQVRIGTSKNAPIRQLNFPHVSDPELFRRQMERLPKLKGKVEIVGTGLINVLRPDEALNAIYETLGLTDREDAK